MIERLNIVSPTSLRAARAIAHRAVQYPTLAARANLAARTDDSHSNLGWDSTAGAFVSHPIEGRAGKWSVTVSLAPLTLALTDGNGNQERFELADKSVRETDGWFDSVLARAELKQISGTALPYELPDEVNGIARFEPANLSSELDVLAGWYGLADRLLSNVAHGLAGVSPGPSAVRCWPHHFDIATYVSLEAGDFETARGIGMGLSPGDESYDQPYFYINPWPHLPAKGLPDLPPPGHWHTAGFVGAIATGEEVLSLPDIEDGMTTFLSGSFELGRKGLDI